MNYFGAASTVFHEEWNNPDKYILTKSVGFEGLISALTVLVPAGESLGDLSKDHFVDVFLKLKEQLAESNIELTSKAFPSSSQNANQLSKMIIAASQEQFGQ